MKNVVVVKPISEVPPDEVRDIVGLCNHPEELAIISKCMQGMFECPFTKYNAELECGNCWRKGCEHHA